MSNRYEDWMIEVNEAVQRLTGVSVHDLADWCSYDLWESGTTPEDAAREIIANDGVFLPILTGEFHTDY